jgi:predicted ABC-type transport system involved in lysophospholipase L1 biosynthesis ATPase subunit
VGTDVTVTQPPTSGSGGGQNFNFAGRIGQSGSKSTSVSRDVLVGGGLVGVVAAAQGVTDTDVYIPLARAQSLASMPSEVNTIYVSAASATDINTVSSEISKALPTATVTTSSDLANEVTGSLSSASSLANSLGKWLAVAVLAAAFFLASILTMAAVARRVREFGTLKAIGWTSRRIIRQIMGESLVIGVIGGLAGIGVGFGAAANVQAVAPPLTATASNGASAAGSRFGGLGHAAPTVSVHLTAPVTLGAVGLAVLLAIAGGLIAGSLGGWRIVRLRPAAALSRLRATAGIVELAGQDLSRLSESRLTKVRAASIGFIFQTFNLIPTLSAQENVETALVPLGVTGAGRRDRAVQALAEVGLGDRARHLPSELSGGQQQRVAVARALVKRPVVLLADEPTGNLDEGTRDEIMALLEQLWREHGLTLVVVTHDSSVARRAQRIGLMRNGRLEVRPTAPTVRGNSS